MRLISLLRVASLLVSIALLVVFSPVGVNGGPANQGPKAQPNRVAVDAGDIGGVVSGPKGPEAGVWVIAETTGLPTKFRKIVVTNDQGRFLLPDLPKANYKVWVRGYGLVDSEPVQAAPGKTVSLKAVPAPSAQAAAQYYPSNYWLSLIKIPPKNEFPMNRAGGTAAAGEGRPGGGTPGAGHGQQNPSRQSGEGQNPEAVTNRGMENQATWINTVKSGCEGCHQLGNKATREINPGLGSFHSTVEAWDARVKAGPMGAAMSGNMNQLGRQRGLAMFADWTDRIKVGEFPREAPPRPQGIERNVVITEWEWGGPTDWVHDEVSTDKRNPRLNANGPVYASFIGSGSLGVLDPKTNTVTKIPVPIASGVDRNKMSLILYTKGEDQLIPSPNWGREDIWLPGLYANLHNPMLDQKGRVWVASASRPNADQPNYCKENSNNPYAQMFPLPQSSRQVSSYDPGTEKFTQINSCFSTHHVLFGEDKDNTVYFSGNEGIAWINTRLLDETGDQEKAQGWCFAYLDSNGDGKIDPATDTRIRGGAYGIIVNPVDQSVWYAVGGSPGKIVRMERGSHPPASCRAEVYEPPAGKIQGGQEGYGPRGIDVDRNGLIWVSLSSSGQLASFDRGKCKVLSGPSATGQHCPEGWKLYQVPGPTLANTDGISADFLYYNWVDQFDTFGLGQNVPFATGSGSDSLLALNPSTGKWTTLRVPYPLGFYSRGMDGRIDDPKAGWKGRGVWASYGPIPNWHIEGGKGTPPSLVHFQLRPDPLAK